MVLCCCCYYSGNYIQGMRLPYPRLSRCTAKLSSCAMWTVGQTTQQDGFRPFGCGGCCTRTMNEWQTRFQKRRGHGGTIAILVLSLNSPTWPVTSRRPIPRSQLLFLYFCAQLFLPLCQFSCFPSSFQTIPSSNQSATVGCWTLQELASPTTREGLPRP